MRARASNAWSGRMVAARFQSGLCEEPEEGIRLAAGKLIDQALEAQGPGTNVRVNAFGSHSKDYSSGAVRNSLSITITPI